MSGLKVELSDGQINNAIAVALAESFSPERRDAIIRDIVRAHLTTKVSDYSKETILSKAVGEQVRQIATEQIRAKIEAMRPEIEAAVRASLGERFQASVMAQLQTALTNKLVSGISLAVDIDAS